MAIDDLATPATRKSASEILTNLKRKIALPTGGEFIRLCTLSVPMPTYCQFASIEYTQRTANQNIGKLFHGFAFERVPTTCRSFCSGINVVNVCDFNMNMYLHIQKYRSKTRVNRDGSVIRKPDVE